MIQEMMEALNKGEVADEADVANITDVGDSGDEGGVYTEEKKPMKLM